MLHFPGLLRPQKGGALLRAFFINRLAGPFCNEMRSRLERMPSTGPPRFAKTRLAGEGRASSFAPGVRDARILPNSIRSMIRRSGSIESADFRIAGRVRLYSRIHPLFRNCNFPEPQDCDGSISDFVLSNASNLPRYSVSICAGAFKTYSFAFSNSDLSRLAR